MLGCSGSAATLIFFVAVAAAGSDIILADSGLNGRKLFDCGCQLIGMSKHHKDDISHPQLPYIPLHTPTKPTLPYKKIPKNPSQIPQSPSKPLILSNFPKIFNIYLKFFQKYLVD